MAEMTLAELGKRRVKLREQLRVVTEQLQEAALVALADGRSESEVAREAQVDRMTMRKWQGKR